MNTAKLRIVRRKTGKFGFRILLTDGTQIASRFGFGTKETAVFIGVKVSGELGFKPKLRPVTA